MSLSLMFVTSGVWPRSPDCLRSVSACTREGAGWPLHSLEAASEAEEGFEAVRLCLIFLMLTEWSDEVSESSLKALRRLRLRPLEGQGYQSRQLSETPRGPASFPSWPA